MIELRLLGSIELSGSSSKRPHLDAILAQPRRTALLAYLALAGSGAPLRRDRLLGVFWPEFPQARARAALRRALSFLRKRLGDGVLLAHGDDMIALAPESLSCDAVGFRKALHEGRRELALELYLGPLLDGFFVRDAAEFERWMERERWRLQSAATQAAVQLADAAERAADLSDAVAWLRRALEIAPADEGAMRRLLSVLVRAGERTAAVRAFESFARQLAEIYDLEPSPQTQHLIVAITSGRPLGATVGPKQHLRSARTEARDLAAEAWTLAERSESDNRRAVELLQRAIHLDESCAEAYAGLATAQAHGVQLFGRARGELAAAVHAARTAVALDPSVPQAHFALGLGLETAGRLAEAETAYRTAAALDPISGPTTSQLGRAMMLSGDFAESLRWAQRSHSLAPEDPHTSLQIALDLYLLGLENEGDGWYETTLETWPEFLWAEASWAYFALSQGDHREARRRTDRTLDRDPENFLGRFTAGMITLFEGDARQAANFFESLYNLDPSGRHTGIFLSTRAVLAYLKLREGDRAGAEELLRAAERENLQALAGGTSFGGIFYDQAAVYAVSGQDERALDWLEASKAAGFLQPSYTSRDPLLEPLRRYDRFGRIVKGVEADIREQREVAASFGGL